MKVNKRQAAYSKSRSQHYGVWSFVASVAVFGCSFALDRTLSIPAPGGSAPIPDNGTLDLRFSDTDAQVQGFSLGAPNSPAEQDVSTSTLYTAGGENLTIPAASEWGLIIMALLVLTIAKLQSQTRLNL